jgi:hypothetical protein
MIQKLSKGYSIAFAVVAMVMKGYSAKVRRK